MGDFFDPYVLLFRYSSGTFSGTQPLLYKGNEEVGDMEIGSIAIIPYGKKEEYGIVARKYELYEIEQGDMEIRSILGQKTSKNILAPYQIEMVGHISERYMLPIHRVVSIFLTRNILSRLEKKNYDQISTHHSESYDGLVEPAREIHIFQNSIVTPDIVKNYLDAGVVFIFPDDFSLFPYQREFADRTDIAFFYNEFSDVKKAQAWIDIKNKKYPIIFGTRRILYYNLDLYKHIVYIEDALGGDYWHYPIRIRFLDILHFFEQSCTKHSITVLTSVPTLSLLSAFHTFSLKNIT